MKLNKSVYVGGGDVIQCEYDTDDLTLSPLWITIFVISLALNLFAIVGNIIVVIACFFQLKKPKVPPLIIYIAALAVSDLLYALVAPFYTYRYVLQHWPNLTINFGLAGKLSHNVTLVGNTFSTISSWLIVLLTLDRLILTRFPFAASRLSTPRRAVFAVILVILCCCAVNAVWMYEFFEVPIEIFDCNGYWKIPTEVVGADGSVYIPIRYRKPYWLYAIISTVLFMYALPTLIIVTSNVLIAHTLNRKISPKLNTQKRKVEVRLTKMIVVVSVVFLISNMPDIATRLLWKFVSPLIVGKVQPIAHLLLMVNVGANFVVYSLFNKHLFTTITNICCRRCTKTSDNTKVDNSASSRRWETQSTGVSA